MVHNEDIRCPICSLNLQILTERKREEHCDACLDSPVIKDSTQSTKFEAVNLNPSSNTPLSQTIKIEEELNRNAEAKEIKKASSLLSWSFLLGKRGRDESGSRTPPKRAEVFSAGASSIKDTSKKQLTPEKRKMPFYKTLTFGSSKIAVDAFNYGPIKDVRAYFLTHFHSDHYGGLTKKWCHGPIYCSAATARLAHLKLRVEEDMLRPLEMYKEYNIEGIKVLLLDANHCPGAAVFLFDNHTLHTGDFRATETLMQELRLATSHLHTVYLDTTYLDPDRKFPAQELVVQVCAEYCVQAQAKPLKQGFFTETPEQRKILVIVGTYTIGKEKLALEIARRLNGKIWAQPWKHKVLETIGDPTLNAPLCDDGTDAQVHLVSMNELSLAKLEPKWKHLRKHFTQLIAFVPTGWTWSKKETQFSLQTLENPKTTTCAQGGAIRICRVPYSEHSSFSELESFCRSVACKNIIATVHTRRYDILRSWESRN